MFETNRIMAKTLEETVVSLFWDRDTPPPVESELALWRVMDLGDWDAILLLEERFSKQWLEGLLRRAPAGSLSGRSRRFWKVRLGLQELPNPNRLPDTDHHELPFRNSG